MSRYLIHSNSGIDVESERARDAHAAAQMDKEGHGLDWAGISRGATMS